MFLSVIGDILEFKKLTKKIYFKFSDQNYLCAMSTESEDRPVQIVKIDDESETHNFILDEDALNEILNRDEIRDKPICIISVAGKVVVKQ